MVLMAVASLEVTVVPGLMLRSSNLAKRKSDGGQARIGSSRWSRRHITQLSNLFGIALQPGAHIVGHLAGIETACQAVESNTGSVRSSAEAIT